MVALFARVRYVHFEYLTREMPITSLLLSSLLPSDQSFRWPWCSLWLPGPRNKVETARHVHGMPHALFL